jgi:hypothetical protein
VLNTTQRRALGAMIVLVTAVMIFHLLVIAQVIPYTVVWAGRLGSVEEMYVFELLSIAVNTLLLGVLLLKAGFIKNIFPQRLLNGILWFFLVLFALNTLGNLTAATAFEKFVFTPLTLLSAILIGVVLWKRG